MPIINSILDNDLYKFTMQRAVLSYKQGVRARSAFCNRRPEAKFNEPFMKAFKTELEAMAELKAQDREIDFMVEKTPFLGLEYFEYLRNYRFHHKTVTPALCDGELHLDIDGTWDHEILWEVPLMAIISELYFIHCDQDWNPSLEVQEAKIREKATLLGDTTFTDFGTRRRRNYATQDLVVRLFKDLSPNFVGTSNVHLAHKYNLKPIGTMAHEWIMGISALESLRHANRFAMKIWSDVYKGDLGTALPDTYGDTAFWNDFDQYLARLFDGIRHDSGCHFKFTDRCIDEYKKRRIDPMTKFAIFTNGLDIPTVLAIREYCENRIRCSFGIGTNLTNDYEKLNSDLKSLPLNMVIKLAMCAGLYVVKLSNDIGKVMGDRDAVRVAKYTHLQIPLDS